MITIRDADQRTVLAQGPAAREITRRAAAIPVADVNVRVAGGKALLTVRWQDGSSGTCEWARDRACLDWLRSQAWASMRTTIVWPCLEASV